MRAAARAGAGLCVVLLGMVGLACSAAQDGEDDTDQGALNHQSSTTGNQNALLVTDVSTLKALEQHGVSFEKMMGATGPSGRALLSSKSYKTIVDTVAADLSDVHEHDSQSGVGVDFEHRLFDPNWLKSTQSRFELIGVVNRIDKRKAGTCGELRFVYRFAYTASRTEGRLPMTVSLIADQPDDNQSCSLVAHRWLAVTNPSADALLGGPLKDRQPFHTVEINLQSERWNFRNDFGGHAEYILRGFSVQGDRLVPAPLTNTPRTDLKAAERTELLGWIRDNLSAVDEGTAELPAKFLATKAVSVGPYGAARLSNRPFSQIFPDAASAFSGFPLEGTKQLGSPAALIRRLDTMTCQGCHQARATAGFHLLGDERDATARLNALAVGSSNHLLEELGWRMQSLTAAANKRALDVPRPFAEHGSPEGRFGTHCGLGDRGFRAWTCPSGFECLDNHGDVVGICSPTGTRYAPIGNACEVGKVTLDANSHSDTLTNRRNLECKPDPLLAARQVSSCMAPSFGNGFPDGVCFAVCPNSDMGKVDGDSICGAIPNKKALNDCLTVEHAPFKECLKRTINGNMQRKCSAKEPCRDDYACMRVPNGTEDTGFCAPPYFAFQARVDGHMFDE